MAANEKLESFLAAQEPAPADTPTPPAPEPQEPPKPEPQPAEPDKTKAAAATPEPADDDDDEAPEARPGEPAVPRNALIDERNKRRDWKAKAVAAEAKLEEYTKRLEALEKRQQAPPPPQPQQQPSQQFQFTPWEVDPVRRQQEEVVNLKFEQSEQFARHRLGDEAVDQLINDFAELTAQNPVLRMQLFQQRDPFGWAHKEVERQRLLREVGDDPTAYRERMIAEERAKWEAEFAARTGATMNLPKNTPPPAMPPSLAGVRSIAPRGAPAWTGPLSDDQVAADMRERRMASRR